jgi:tRNA A-37 threonylcarbamoyl transferase component Bud32
MSTPIFREVGPQEIPEEDGSALKRAQEMLGISGPFVGGLLAEGRHSRALVLHRGENFVLRIERIPTSATAIAMQYLHRLKGIQVQLSSVPSLYAAVSGNSLFYARKYYRMGPVLDRMPQDVPKRERVRNARRLLRIVNELHRNQLFHGHFTGANLYEIEGEASSRTSRGIQYSVVDLGVAFLSSPDAGRFHSLREAVESGQYLDHQALFKLYQSYWGEISLAAPEHLYGTDGFLPALDQQLAAQEPKTPPRAQAASSNPRESSEAPTRTREKHGTLQKPTPHVGRHKSSSSKTTPSTVIRSSSWNMLLFGGLALLAIVALLHFGTGAVFHSPESFQDYRTQWLSNSPSLMLEVAKEAALQNDTVAQKVILESVELREGDSSQYLSESLRIALHSPWFQDLEEADRRALFAYVLAPLLKGEVQRIPPLEDVHPGVALALLGGLPENRDPTRLFRGLRARLDALPDPYRSAFEVLQGEGDVAATSAMRAFIQLMAGKYTQRAFMTYLPRGTDPLTTKNRVSVLIPTLREQDADLLWKYLVRIPAGVAVASWFESSPIVDWSTLSARSRIGLAFGENIPPNLSLEQSADLLRAPFLSHASKETLAQQLEAQAKRSHLEDFFDVLITHPELNREEVLSLVSSLAIDGDALHVFIDQWFQTQPAPNAVFALLLSLSGRMPFEAFNIPAARYLREHDEWSVTEGQLYALAGHPEPLARALAYTRADLDVPAQRAILERRHGLETSQSLRRLLESKLSR